MPSELAAAASPDKWADHGLSGLVIWALFLMVALMLWMLEKKLTRVADECANLALAIEKARSGIVEKLYEAGVLDNRRGRELGINQHRRKGENYENQD